MAPTARWCVGSWSGRAPAIFVDPSLAHRRDDGGALGARSRSGTSLFESAPLDTILRFGNARALIPFPGRVGTSGRTYGGTIAAGNPLAGRTAFVTDTFGYTASRLDLSSHGGDDLRFRFRIGTDVVDDVDGWFIDEFRIYTCCTAARVLSDATVSGVETQTACVKITAGNDGSGDYVVGTTGDLTLVAPTIVLTDGFAVQSGGKLTAGPP